MMSEPNEELVTKQSVIDTFLYCVNWQNANGEPESVENKRAFLEKVMRIVPPAYRERGRWIPCNERLPEIGDAYIVTGIQKDAHEKEWHYFVDVASSHGDYIDDYWDTFNDWIEGQETHIVAWMPLPKPYKMDEVSE